MKLCYLLLLSTWLTPIDNTTRLNQLKKKAAQALAKENYALAAQTYAYLVDTLYAPDNKGYMRLNLAHAYLKQGDTLSALNQYQELSQRIRTGNTPAEALNQMGLISYEKQQRTLALNLLKNALKADPTHEKARYNYQVVKKSLENNPENSQSQRNNDNTRNNSKESEKDNAQQEQQKEKKQQEQQEQESASQDRKQQEEEKQNKTSSEKKEQQRKQQKEQQDEEKESAKEQLAEKLENMDFSEEKANMILDALRNNELQYIQQLKRRSSKPQSIEKDW